MAVDSPLGPRAGTASPRCRGPPWTADGEVPFDMKVGDAAGSWEAEAAYARDVHNASRCSLSDGGSVSRSTYLHRNGLPEESNVADISEITRTGLRSGGTFMSCGGASTLQQKVPVLAGEGGMDEAVHDISEIMRPSFRGGTFVSSAGSPLSNQPRVFLGHGGMEKVGDLGDITRTGLRSGGTQMSSSGRALDINRKIPQAPCRPRSQSGRSRRATTGGCCSDGKVTDLSQITRTGLRSGSTYMSSAGRPLSAKPPVLKQADRDGKVNDLSQIMRPHLRSSSTYMSSAGRALSPNLPERRPGRLYAGEEEAAVNDLSQITRPHLRSGTTYVSSTGRPLHAAYAGSTHLYDSGTSYSVRSC